MKTMTDEARTLKVKQLIQKWNRLHSSHHDEYYGEIADIAFAGEYDCVQELNYITDFNKLTEIWKLSERTACEPTEFLKEVQRIIYM